MLLWGLKCSFFLFLSIVRTNFFFLWTFMWLLYFFYVFLQKSFFLLLSFLRGRRERENLGTSDFYGNYSAYKSKHIKTFHKYTLVEALVFFLTLASRTNTWLFNQNFCKEWNNLAIENVKSSCRMFDHIKCLYLQNYFLNSLWGAVHAVFFNIIVFMTIMAHVRAVFSDPGIVPLPQSRLDFSDMHAGKCWRRY